MDRKAGALEALVNPSPEFWRGKRVLLTGHTGFKGAWLFHWLELLGAEVTGLALAPDTEPCLASLSGIASSPNSIIGDIRDAALLRQTLEVGEHDIVLHLAAQAIVRRSYQNPLESFSTNIMGTLHLLEAASRQETVRAFVVVTTDKCYLNREWLWPYREDEPLGGHDPYSASKAGTEIVTAAWRSSLSDMTQFPRTKGPLHIATARAGNVFGGGDWATDRLVPDFFRAIAKGEDLILRNPHARRPWQHVLEPLCGYLLLAEQLWNGQATEAWNFGPAQEDVQPVSVLAEHLCNASENRSRWQAQGGPHPHEASLLALDTSKARALLNWRPRLPLKPALEWTYEWYSREANGSSATDLTVAQIERYTNLRSDWDLAPTTPNDRLGA